MSTAWPFVQRMLIFEELDSTNTTARAIALDPDRREPLPLGLWARRQTRGRGQRESSWWSDEGSLTFSLLLDPAAHRLRLDQTPRLALTAAVALIETVADLGWTDPGLGVRWPNDLEYKDRKIAGILPERIETDRSDRLIIGVGVNVASRLDHAPPEIRAMAGSLGELQPEPLAPDVLPKFLAAFLNRFPSTLNRLADDDPGLAAQVSRLDQLRDRPIRMALGPRSLSGIARGVAPDGALLVDDGREIHHLFGGRVLRDHRHAKTRE